MNQRLLRIPDGQKTKIIYTHIKENRYDDAIKILNHEMQFCQKSKVISLLGYCYYMKQDYNNASRIYEELSFLYPSNDEYKYYCGLSLYKNGDYESSLRVLTSIQSEEWKNKIATLIAYIKYDLDDLQRAKTILQTREHEDINFIVLDGAINYKEGKIEEAKKLFEKGKNMAGNNCELIYNVALSYYKNKEYDKCMHHIAEIIEKGTREHQELCVGIRDKEGDIMSVGNTLALKESALVEAFNLKAAIEYNLKNINNAKEALGDMPPRKEEELDPVTLMNNALIFFDNDPSNSFKKLNFLLANPPFPPETFCNLLLLYTKHEYYDLAADILAENTEFTYKYLNDEDFEYIEALIFQNASLEDTAKKFEELGMRHLENLRRITKQIKEAQREKNNASLQKTLKQYDDNLQAYIPVLMAHAKLYWNKKDYSMVERIFKQSQDFCSISDVWRLNLAHVYFIQEKYPEALQYYETIYEKNMENILEIPAIVIANLCVTCIMVNQNDKAEEIIKLLEEMEMKEEEKNGGEINHYHLCIVNLVIGTLYCSKNNYEFGITRIIKSFDPIQKKLCTDTWYYTKRCFLSLLEKLTKNMFILQDQIIIDILTFLINCEEIGKDIKTRIEPTGNYDEKNSVAYEARLLRIIFIKLRESN